MASHESFGQFLLFFNVLVISGLFVPGCCDEADLSCFLGSATFISLLQFLRVMSVAGDVNVI